MLATRFKAVPQNLWNKATNYTKQSNRAGSEHRSDYKPCKQTLNSYINVHDGECTALFHSDVSINLTLTFCMHLS